MARLNDPHLLFAISLINMADQDKAKGGIRIAGDLMDVASLADHADLPVCIRKLNGLLEDPDVSSAEMKGLLNRVSGKTWGLEYDRAFTPRQFLEALKSALEEYVGRRGLR